MAEYARSTGGVLDVVTKSGSDEVHGSAWFDVSPGALEGTRAPVPVVAGQTLRSTPAVDLIQSFGAEVGGPVVKGRLWFHGGALFSSTRYRVEEALHRRVLDPISPLFDDAGVGHPEIGNDFRYDENGDPVTERVPGSESVLPAVSTSLQYTGKLTFAPAPGHRLDLSLSGNRTASGDNGGWGIAPRTGDIEGGAGDHSALAHRYTDEATGAVLRWQGAFQERTLLVDARLGWHHQRAARLPSDGSVLGGKAGFAGIPSVVWQKSFPVHHDIKEFRDVAGGSATCADALVQDVDNDGDGAPDAVVQRDAQCPARSYFSGGSAFIDEQDMDRVHATLAVTKRFLLLGHHSAKAGLDVEQSALVHTRAYSGTVRYAESSTGSIFNETRRYGFLTGPDTAVVQDLQTASVSSTQIGAYLQDTWRLLDKVTVSLGVRYDAQAMFGDGGQLRLALPSQVSPRAGLVYDFTQRGRSRVFAHYARYYEALPLDIAGRAFPGEGQIGARHRAALCDPSGMDAAKTCDASSLSSRARVFGTSFDPNQRWFSHGTASTPVDPGIQPQAMDQIVTGVEYELISNARVGVVYTHTSLVNAIEDMGLGEGYTLFIGNPGSGIAKSFPKAQRDYDGVNLLFTKPFGDRWLAQVSYTLSFLRGNLAGLYRPESGQLDPNVTSDFDLTSLTVNRTGPLPGDRTHEIKVYAARDFRFDEFLPGPSGMSLDVGLGYTGRSGAPTSFLGAHPIYGAGETYLLERGSGERLPWIHSVDARVQYTVKLAGGSTLGIGMDVFNMFNFQDAIAVDQNYTFFDIAPIPGGKPVKGPDGKLGVPPALDDPHPDAFDPFDQRNPNFGRPTAYQPPLTFRFGAHVAF